MKFGRINRAKISDIEKLAVMMGTTLYKRRVDKVFERGGGGEWSVGRSVGRLIGASVCAKTADGKNESEEC